jgi:hypothetical protein
MWADYLRLELDKSAAALMSEQQIAELLNSVVSLALSQTASSASQVSGLHLYNSKPSSEISFLRRVDRNRDAPLRRASLLRSPLIRMIRPIPYLAGCT